MIKLPEKIIVGGIIWKIIIVDLLFSSNDELLYGIENENIQEIRIGKCGFHINDNGEMVKDKRQDSFLLKTLFHELFHIVCNCLSEEDYNKEENCCTFASVCMVEEKRIRNAELHTIDIPFSMMSTLKKKKEEKMTNMTNITLNRFLYIFSNIQVIY